LLKDGDDLQKRIRVAGEKAPATAKERAKGVGEAHSVEWSLVAVKADAIRVELATASLALGLDLLCVCTCLEQDVTEDEGQEQIDHASSE
jgi:hypothetical protein